jgi:thymidylate synthase (FAD)
MDVEHKDKGNCSNDLNSPVFPLGDDKGSVRLVGVMPESDVEAAIVRAARVSYQKGTKKRSDDAALIRYLYRHWHTTPFEMVEFTFHLKLPIFVARQLIRHRTANVNELSARYSEVPDEFYIPTPNGVRAQSTTNRQGSSDVSLPDNVVQHFIFDVESTTKDAYRRYQNALKSGVSRELARMLLPLNTYTEMFWKMDLHNLLHFLRLRMDEHAQYEIRCYANAIASFVKAKCPVAYSAFVDYRVTSVHLSASEIAAVAPFLPPSPPPLASTSVTEKTEWTKKYSKMSTK